MANEIDRVLRRTRKTLKRHGCYIDYKWDLRKGKGSHGVVTITHEGKSTDMIFSTTRGIDSGKHIRGAVKRTLLEGLNERINIYVYFTSIFKVDVDLYEYIRNAV